MNMELRQLEYMVAVADEGQFTRAADRCGVAQSALSSSVRSLERELGSPLFARTTRRVSLTEAGRAFAVEARRVLAGARSARQVVEEVRGLHRGTLSVGTIPSAAVWFDAPRLLGAFCRAHPGIDLTTVAGPAPTLLDQVASGALDVAVTGLPASLPPGLEARPLVSVPLAFGCHVDHPLASQLAVGLEALGDETFIDLPTTSVVRQVTDAVFAAGGHRKTVRFEVNDLQTALGFLSEGLGVACLPWPPDYPPSVRFIPLAEHWPAWTLAMVVANGERLNPAAAELLAQLDQVGAVSADPLDSGPVVQ